MKNIIMRILLAISLILSMISLIYHNMIPQITHQNPKTAPVV